MPIWFIACLSIFCLAMLLFMLRTWRVHKFRIGLLRSDLDTYLRLPSYDAMVLNFWKPLSSFVEGGDDDPGEGPAPVDSEETHELIAPSEEERKQPVD